MFKEFDHEVSFAGLLRSALSRRITALVKSDTPDPSKVESTHRSLAESPTDHSGVEAEPSLLRAAELIRTNADLQAEYWPIVRSYIAASALYSHVHDAEVLDTHALMSAYRQGDGWNITALETNLLVRSFLGNEAEYVAGWYWLRDLDKAAQQHLLQTLALSDDNVSVQRGALFRLHQGQFLVEENFVIRALAERPSNSPDYLRHVLNLAKKIPSENLLAKIAASMSPLTPKQPGYSKTPLQPYW